MLFSKIVFLAILIYSSILNRFSEIDDGRDGIIVSTFPYHYQRKTIGRTTIFESGQIYSNEKNSTVVIVEDDYLNKHERNNTRVEEANIIPTKNLEMDSVDEKPISGKNDVTIVENDHGEVNQSTTTHIPPSVITQPPQPVVTQSPQQATMQPIIVVTQPPQKTTTQPPQLILTQPPQAVVTQPPQPIRTQPPQIASHSSSTNKRRNTQRLKLYKTKNLGYERETSRRRLHNNIFIQDKLSVKVTLFTTTNTISLKTNNTFNSFKYFREEFGVTSLVFTDSEEVKRVCDSFGIHTEKIPLNNKFGLPYFQNMIQSAKTSHPNEFYIYTNSDILLNPLIFKVLPGLKRNVPTPSLYCGRVIVTNSVPKVVDYRDPNLFEQLANDTHHLRNSLEIDYFIFSSNFPFQNILPVVLGRWGVDSSILMLAHKMHIPVVDMTNLQSYHQGKNASSRKKLEYKEDDWKWNFQYVKRNLISREGSLSSTYLIESSFLNAY